MTTAFNPMDLTGQTIVVTGASSGIGRAASVYLSRLGAKIALVGRDEARLRDAWNSLEGEGHCIEPHDLSRLDEIPEWMKDVAGRVGPLHGLVHSAGVQQTLPIRMFKAEKARELLDVNVVAAMSLTHGFRRKGVCAAQGSIVLVSSVVALVGQAGVAAYSASKGALIALAKSLAIELARDQIRVNCVAPGHVQTPMADRFRAMLTDDQFGELERRHPLGIGAPDDVAGAIAYLLCPASRWVTGTALVVDGGYTAQ